MSPYPCKLLCLGLLAGLFLSPPAHTKDPGYRDTIRKFAADTQLETRSTHRLQPRHYRRRHRMGKDLRGIETSTTVLGQALSDFDVGAAWVAIKDIDRQIGTVGLNGGQAVVDALIDGVDSLIEQGCPCSPLYP